jgi:hypothetical protein
LLQKALRETQNNLYEYNVDMLERASFAITEVRKLFAKYLSVNQSRERLVGNNQALLEMADEQGVDLERGLDMEFEDDMDADEDAEDRRLHYEKFAFVEMSVAIHKARESLEGIVKKIKIDLYIFQHRAAYRHCWRGLRS